MTPQAAISLATWIAQVHPEIFAELARRANAGATVTPGGRRLGALRAARTLRARRVGALGDDFDFLSTGLDYGNYASDFTYTAPDTTDQWAGAWDTEPTDYSNGSYADQAQWAGAWEGEPTDYSGGSYGDSSVLFSTPPLQTVNVDQSGAVPGINAPAPAATSSGGFISGVTGAIGAAVSGVAGFLTSTQGLSSLAGLASTYFNSQAQSAVLQTQVARAQAGQTAAPITYTMNAQGQLVPVVGNPATGQIAYNAQGQPYVVTPQTLAQYASGASVLSGLPTWLPWAAGGALLLAVLVSSRKSI